MTGTSITDPGELAAPDGSHRSAVRFFAAASDQPRVRRSGDAAVVVVGAATIVLLAVVRGDGTPLDRAWGDLVVELPGWVVWLGHAAYLLGAAAASALLVAVALVARRRLELLRDLLAAAALAVAGGSVLARVVDERWPAVALTDLARTRTTFPAFVVMAVIAVQAAVAPHLAVPFRRAGWGIALACAAGAVIGGVSQPSDVAGAILVGLVAASVVRFAFGTSAGVPSLAQVRGGLAELGVELDELAYDDRQPPTSTILVGTTTGGRLVYVRVLDRDSWKNTLWSRWWRSAWYQDDDVQYGSTRRQQLEHEALAGLLASRANVRVADLVVVGSTGDGDAALVVDRPLVRLDTLAHDAIDDVLLDRIWAAVVDLHAADVSHGGLASHRIWVEDGDMPALGDFSRARIAATDDAKRRDVAQLLVVSAMLVGEERAITAARRATGDDVLADALAALQPAALTPDVRHDARRTKLKIDDLRSATATALGVEVPALEKLQRVSIGHVALMAFTVVAVYGIISGLAEIGFDTIAEALSEATWGLVLVALVLTQLTNVTDATSLAAASPKPVPIGITSVEQLAIGFVNLAVPTAAGHLAVNIRYFQRFGISAIASSASATIVSMVGFLAQVLLLVLTIVVGHQSLDLSQLSSGGGVPGLIGVAVAIGLAAVVVVLVVPALRKWFGDKLRTPLQEVRGALEVMKHPRNLLIALGGQVGTQVLFAGGLMLSVLAMGGSLNLGQALFINIVVSVFAGIMPVPGGIGVTEAGLTAGLTSVGVASEIALPAVIVYRLCSYYLPPVWGWIALQWLTRHDYL